MENPILATLSNTTSLTISEMDQLIPKELQMPIGIAVRQPCCCDCCYFSTLQHCSRCVSFS